MTLSETSADAAGDAPAAPARRRRTRKPDAVLAEAVEQARTALLDIAPEASIGTGHEVRGEEDRLTTHLFECTLPGYRGWTWFATLSRAPRSKTATVCEIGLLPTDAAVVAPDWVPWSERVRPEDSQTGEGQEAGEQPAEAPEPGETSGDRTAAAADTASEED